MKKLTANKQILYLLIIAAVCVSSVVCTNAWTRINANRKTLLGIKVLRTLYEFENLTQFGENVGKFEKLVTPRVFNLMTADNSDRILRVYLKFNGNPSYVEVLEATDSYIIYSLVCESVERDRIFLMSYSTSGGKITDIREAEVFKFPTTSAWEPDLTLLPPIELPYGGE